MPLAKGTVVIDVNDIIGKELGRLVVSEYAGSDYTFTNGKYGVRMRHYYKCLCACGNIKLIRRSSLKNNKTNSCGCTRKNKRR